MIANLETGTSSGVRFVGTLKCFGKETAQICALIDKLNTLLIVKVVYFFFPHHSCVFQQKGVIRVSGISLDYSESELIKMASPFSHPVEILMATEVDMETCLEWKKVCTILEYKHINLKLNCDKFCLFFFYKKNTVLL